MQRQVWDDIPFAGRLAFTAPTGEQNDQPGGGIRPRYISGPFRPSALEARLILEHVGPNGGNSRRLYGCSCPFVTTKFPIISDG